MADKEIGKLVKELNAKYENVNIRKIEKTSSGYAVYMRPAHLAGFSDNMYRETSSVLYRSPLERTDLDLAKKAIIGSTPQELFERSYNYYYSNGIYGTVIDTLSNLSAKGFENDIDDPAIKYYYDSWNIQCSFKKIIRWILLDFFRIGMVRTYKVLGKYDPPISYLKPPQAEQEEGKETAQRKKRWSKNYVPTLYTVLNPLNVEIEGNLLFDTYKVTLKPSAELRDLFKKKSSDLLEQEKEIIKNLPPEWKKALSTGGNIPLDPDFVGSVDYRKQPYERYPRPRGARAFDSLEYKAKLKEADLSTLDGITNQILKITIGNDEFPCTSQDELDKIAALFNTPAKAFNIVYNHTLQIEKVVSPEIEAILGQEKYAQVNDDLTGAFGIVRSLIDGGGEITSGGAQLAVKAIIEEVNYARDELTEWVYQEYRQVAEAAGFDRHPKVRWDDMVLKDEIMMTSLIQGMIDRRIISYQTGHEKLGLEFDTELKQLEREKPLVLSGSLGLWGSPYNSKAQPFVETPVKDNPENNPNNNPGLSPDKTQLTPDGTPSEGRPRGNPGKKKKKALPKDQTKVRKPQIGSLSLGQFKFSKGY